MATSETGSLHDQSGWCFAEESFFSDKSLEVNDEEYTLATVMNNQEQEDVPTTAPDGDVNPRWLEVCQEKGR